MADPLLRKARNTTSQRPGRCSSCRAAAESGPCQCRPREGSVCGPSASDVQSAQSRGKPGAREPSRGRSALRDDPVEKAGSTGAVSLRIQARQYLDNGLGSLQGHRGTSDGWRERGRRNNALGQW